MIDAYCFPQSALPGEEIAVHCSTSATRYRGPRGRRDALNDLMRRLSVEPPHPHPPVTAEAERSWRRLQRRSDSRASSTPPAFHASFSPVKVVSLRYLDCFFCIVEWFAWSSPRIPRRARRTIRRSSALTDVTSAEMPSEPSPTARSGLHASLSADCGRNSVNFSHPSGIRR